MKKFAACVAVSLAGISACQSGSVDAPASAGGVSSAGASGAVNSAGGGATSLGFAGSFASLGGGGNTGLAGSFANPGGNGGQSTVMGDSGAAGEANEPPSRTQLQRLPADGFYPRALKLANGTIVASIVAGQKNGHLGGTIFESTDDGLSFHVIGNVIEPGATGGLCCATLYELPRAFGALPAGTLLWSASVGADQKTVPMTLPVWSSTDGGHTWSALSTIVGTVTDPAHRGIWEPEFSLLDDGTLVCYFSDERDPAHSQKLVAVRTSDGKNWSAAKDVVALSDGGYRPGMAVVRRSPGGVFFMSYEVCGVPGDNCGAHLRTSLDGSDWGDPTDIGSRPTTVDGKHFQHAPTITWNTTPSSLGRLFLIGQVAIDANGTTAAENGNFVMANAQGGLQFWFGIDAPVPVSPAPYDNYCPNYSSPLVALDNGAVGLGLASRYDGTTCRTYFARGPLLGSGNSSGIKSGSAYRFVNVTSGLCLDVAGGSMQPHAAVEQATCDGTALEHWALSSAANGAFTIKSQNSGQCLTPAGAETNGTLIEQADCDGSNSQSWTLRGVGSGYFEVQSDGGACLDNQSASTQPGTSIELWSCNHLSPQIWHIELQ